MQTTAPRPFDALRLPGFPAFLITFLLTMMADNVEHVMSYWVMFQKFQSPALGGFAVVSHWLPYLVFSVPVGALNDRFDSRRLIQIGAALFMCVSLGWGYFFVTGTLQIWHAMVLLVMHGCAGVFWLTSSQMLLYDVVGAEGIASAVRLNASARYLGMLVGPGVGSVIMRTLGPTHGMFLNALFYLPLILWLISARYGRHFRVGAKHDFLLQHSRRVRETNSRLEVFLEGLIQTAAVGALYRTASYAHHGRVDRNSSRCLRFLHRRANAFRSSGLV